MEDTNLKEAVCPIKGFGPTEYNSPSNPLYGSDSQSHSQNSEKNDFFGSKDPVSYSLPNMSLMTPKKYDDSQNTQKQDDTSSQDLHNGHNQNDKVVPRTLSISELEPVVEGEPDTVPMDEKDGEGTQVEDCPGNNSHEQMDVDVPTVMNNDLENIIKEKSHTDGESRSQVAFGTFSSEKSSEGGENSTDTKNSEGTIGDSQSFDLHLSQTQSFMLSEGPSDERKPAGVQLDKKDSFDEQSNEPGLKKFDSFDDQSNESVVKKVESSDKQSNESKMKKVDNGDQISNESEIKKGNSSDESAAKKLEGSQESVVKSDDESVTTKAAGTKVDKTVESMDVDNLPAEPKVSTESEGTTSKAVTPKKQVTFEDKLKGTESECSASVSGSIDGSTVCNCVPSCHNRMESIAQHLSSACSQLEDFIKSKKRDDKKLFSNFLDMLKEIQFISENRDVVGETKIIENVFSLEETPKSGRKAATKRKSNDIETPLKATPRKKVAEEKSGKPTEKKAVDFKDLKGLAVFAKWPNSGWYYPGVVEELSANDWKDVQNVTVTFYDGLVRDMKNINILPAYLIPAGSMLCDLEDETEMVVLSCDGSNQNSVDFKLSTKENPEGVLELNFNKLAIKANHMKSIKAQLEPTTDSSSKNMHMVSLDNLVSGRRSSRGKSKKDEDSEEKSEEKTRVERRIATPKKPATTSRRSRN